MSNLINRVIYQIIQSRCAHCRRYTVLTLDKCFNKKFTGAECNSAALKIMTNQLSYNKRKICGVKSVHTSNKYNNPHNSTINSAQFTTMSEEVGTNRVVNYDELVKAQHEGSTLIIDVREQSEIDETGKLPGSIHIPMGDVPNMLKLPAEEFELKYDKKLPSTDTKIVLSCRSGKRSAMVQAELIKWGFNNVWNYSGGWLDWEDKTKKA